jgi:hypothetical protein
MRKGAEVAPQLFPYAAEKGEPFLFGAFKRCRIFEVPMNHDSFARKNRAALFRVIANGQNVIEGLADELVNALRTVARDVDSQLSHDGDCFRSNMARFGPGAEDFEAIAGIMAQ